MTEKEVDDYFVFVNTKAQKLEKRIDAYCFSLNSTYDELINSYYEDLKLTNEILKKVGKDIEKLHELIRPVQDSDRFKLGACCQQIYSLKHQIKNKNLIETFRSYDYLIDDLNHINNRRTNESDRSDSMRKIAKLRLANDPKQKALDEIKSHYDIARHQFRRRGYTAKFVKEMATTYPIIESIKTIERLVAKLNKINKYPVS